MVKKPFYGGYGLIAAGGIPKPAFAAFELLHQLGNKRLALDSDSALATRAADGSLVVAVWNLVAPEQTGAARTVVLRFKNLSGARHASISRVDQEHGDPHLAYEKMGSPVYPTQAQLEKLRSFGPAWGAGSPGNHRRRAKPDAAGERPGSDCNQVGRSFGTV